MAPAYDYFGKEKSDKYRDMVQKELKGKQISKNKELAEQEGGLIYEAKKLGISHLDLLECLEGMCYEQRAAEINDSTYLVF